MDRDRVIVRFGYDEGAEKITSLAMDVRCDNASPVELLCAGMMLHRFAVEEFTKIAIKNGKSKAEAADIIKKISELTTGPVTHHYDGERK